MKNNQYQNYQNQLKNSWMSSWLTKYYQVLIFCHNQHSISFDQELSTIFIHIFQQSDLFKYVWHNNMLLANQSSNQYIAHYSARSSEIKIAENWYTYF